MRRIFFIALSLFLLHAGVAWAIEACLQHDGHADHAASATHSDSHARQGINDPHEPTLPAIHCPTLNREIGPAERATSVQAPRSDRVISLDVGALHGAHSVAGGADVWREALFKRRAVFSPVSLERHLFLSVLRI
jgi:hypothetical protein